MKTVKQLTFGDSVVAYTCGDGYNWDFNSDSMHIGSLTISNSYDSYQAELNKDRLVIGSRNCGNIDPFAGLYICGSCGFVEVKDSSGLGYTTVYPNEISIYQAQSCGSGSFEKIASIGSGIALCGNDEVLYLLSGGCGYMFSGTASFSSNGYTGYSYVSLTASNDVKFDMSQYMENNSTSVSLGISGVHPYIDLCGSGMRFLFDQCGMNVYGSDSSCGNFQFYADTNAFCYSGYLSSGGSSNYFEFSYSPSNGLSLCGQNPRIGIGGFDLIDNCGNMHFFSGNSSGGFSSYTIYPQSITDASGNNYTVLTIQTW